MRLNALAHSSRVQFTLHDPQRCESQQPRELESRNRASSRQYVEIKFGVGGGSTKRYQGSVMHVHNNVTLPLMATA